jgi:hypothetical protein
MRLNFRRWVILLYLLGLAAFSFYLLNIPGEKYRVLTTSDSGFFAGIAEELDSRNGFIDRYSRSHAPTGWPVGVLDQGQPLLAVMLYRGVSAVFPGVRLMDVINLWSPLLFAVFLFAVFLIARELAGDVAGCAAAFFASVLVGSIYWCKFAAFDREALTIVLSSWTLYLSVLTFKRSSLTLAVLTGLTYSLLGLSWGGWLYLAPVLLAALLLLLFHDFLLALFRERRLLSSLSSVLRQHWRLVLDVVCIFVTVTAAVRLLGGSPPDWVGFGRTLLGYVGIGGGGGGALEVTRYASEMQAPGSFGEVFSGMYRSDLLNRIALLLLAVGMMKVLITRKKWEWVVLPWLVILMGLVWPGKGQARFDRLWWPFVAVMAGVGVGALVSAFRWVIKERHEALHFLRPLPFVLVFLFLPFANNAVSAARVTTPPTEWYGGGFDQALVEACRWLENNTPEDTTVAIEWSYGHLLTGASGRRSVCDGVESFGEEGKWENDPSVPCRPPDYIYYVSGNRAVTYGLDVSLFLLEPYRIYGRRTDVLRMPYMDAAELEWFLRTYRDNFGVRIDYLVFDFYDYLNASWADQNWYYFYTLRSSPLYTPSAPPENAGENLLLLHFGENRENVIINTSTGEAYLQVENAPDLLFDGYLELLIDNQGRIQSTNFHKPTRAPDLNETVVIPMSGGSILGGAIFPSRTKEVEARGASIARVVYGGVENRPEFLEPAFISSNYQVVLVRVLWDKIPVTPVAPSPPEFVPEGRWVGIETFQVSG